MDTLFVSTARAVGLLFLGLLAITVTMRCLDGNINIYGLLLKKNNDRSRYFSPERVQLLAVTIWAAGQFVGEVLQNPTARTLPSVPNAMLLLLGGSHGIYLGSKMFTSTLEAAVFTESGDK